MLTVERKSRHVRLTARPEDGLVHGLDDIAADRELAQGALDTGLERPTGWGLLFGEAEPLELRGPGDHQSAWL
jgi:hypothetical protein